MTEDEIKEKVEDINETGPTWFCPLIGSLCNPECYCYTPAIVVENTYDGVYDLRRNLCSNYSMNG